MATISVIFLKMNLTNLVHYYRSPLRSWYDLEEGRSHQKYLGERRSPAFRPTTSLTIIQRQQKLRRASLYTYLFWQCWTRLGAILCRFCDSGAADNCHHLYPQYCTTSTYLHPSTASSHTCSLSRRIVGRSCRFLCLPPASTLMFTSHSKF